MLCVTILFLGSKDGRAPSISAGSVYIAALLAFPRRLSHINMADKRGYVVEDSPTPSYQPSSVSVELGSAQEASALISAAWDLVSYQAELLPNNWLYAALAVLLSSLIFIYCRRARIKGIQPV